MERRPQVEIMMDIGIVQEKYQAVEDQVINYKRSDCQASFPLLEF